MKKILMFLIMMIVLGSFVSGGSLYWNADPDKIKREASTSGNVNSDFVLASKTGVSRPQSADYYDNTFLSQRGNSQLYAQGYTVVFAGTYNQYRAQQTNLDLPQKFKDSISFSNPSTTSLGNMVILKDSTTGKLTSIGHLQEVPDFEGQTYLATRTLIGSPGTSGLIGGYANPGNSHFDFVYYDPDTNKFYDPISDMQFVRPETGVVQEVSSERINQILGFSASSVAVTIDSSPASSATSSPEVTVSPPTVTTPLVPATGAATTTASSSSANELQYYEVELAGDMAGTTAQLWPDGSVHDENGDPIENGDKYLPGTKEGDAAIYTPVYKDKTTGQPIKYSDLAGKPVASSAIAKALQGATPTSATTPTTPTLTYQYDNDDDWEIYGVDGFIGQVHKSGENNRVSYIRVRQADGSYKYYKYDKNKPKEEQMEEITENGIKIALSARKWMAENGAEYTEQQEQQAQQQSQFNFQYSALRNAMDEQLASIATGNYNDLSLIAPVNDQQTTLKGDNKGTYRAVVDEDGNIKIEKSKLWGGWEEVDKDSDEYKAAILNMATENKAAIEKYLPELQEKFTDKESLAEMEEEGNIDIIRDGQGNIGSIRILNEDGKPIFGFDPNSPASLSKYVTQAKTRTREIKLQKDHQIAEQAVSFAIQNALTTFLGPMVDEAIQQYCQDKASSSVPDTNFPTTTTGGMPQLPPQNIPRPPIRGHQDIGQGVDGGADDDDTIDVDGTDDTNNTEEQEDDELCQYISSSSGEIYAEDITNGYDWRYTWTSCDKDLNIRVYLQCETKQITLDSRMIKEGSSLQNSGTRKTLEECKKICIEYPDKRCVLI